MQKKHFLWTEDYRPTKVADTILPDNIKATFQEFVDKGQIPNMLLNGGPGTGKTTIARAMLEELGADYIVINGSLDRNIDTLRNEISQFASSVSFTGGRKYVILDEADGLNPNSIQPALKNFIESYAKNCGFIMTCNNKNKIIEPLHSRVSVIDFKISKKDMPELAKQFMKRVCSILETEGVTYDKPAVAAVIAKFFPDWRRVLNELQRYASSGHIDSGILANVQEVSIKKLMNMLKEKNFTEARKWVSENSDADAQTVFRTLYDTAYEYVTKTSVPQLVLILSKYQYQASFAADQEINLMACLTELMVEMEFI